MILSMWGRCRSIFVLGLLLFNGLGGGMMPAVMALSISCCSSWVLPIHFSSFPSRVRHMGRGVPQKRERLMFQSTRFSSQF